MPKSSPYRGVTLFRPTGKWRAQISANGRTTSLGDHDTQEAAAAAFDRAAINKDGCAARTNFDRDNYSSEMNVLTSLSFNEMVAELRARARKGPGHSSHYRGVSLLRATGRWHAQINAAGKQVHLGFFATEAAAARAYDRAALAKAAQMGDASRVQTNFDASLYRNEVAQLQRMTSPQLVAALAMDPLASSDPETSGHSPQHSGSSGNAAADSGWFEGGGGWYDSADAAPGGTTKAHGRAGSGGGGGDGGGGSRGGSNASSVDVLPHHFGDVLSPESPPWQQESAAAGNGFLHPQLAAGLRLPHPDSLQAQLRQLHHQPTLPPRLQSPSAAEVDHQRQQWQPHADGPAASLAALHQLTGRSADGGAVAPLPPDSWLSPKRASSAAVYSGNSGRPAPPSRMTAAPAPSSPVVESSSQPQWDVPDNPQALQRASRRRAPRKLDDGVYDMSGIPLPPRRTAAAGSKRARPATAPAAAAADIVPVAVLPVAPPPRNRRKGNPTRAVLG